VLTLTLGGGGFPSSDKIREHTVKAATGAESCVGMGIKGAGRRERQKKGSKWYFALLFFSFYFVMFPCFVSPLLLHSC
jgi:hypothetical protein